MQIKLFGAAGEVTGSCYWLRTAHASVLFDCGQFQGSRETERKNRLPNLPLNQLDSVVLTHGHLDHTGRLPLLSKNGWNGPIYATPATIDFTALILRDAAHVQESDTARDNRRRLRAGKPPEEPLFTPADVEKLLSLLKPMPYDTPTEVAPGVRVRAVDAGHMLGSASLEATVEEKGKKKIIIFSGDLGPRGAPLLRDPVPFKQADLVFQESTYGDRDHKPLEQTLAEAAAIIEGVVGRRGKLFVPVFAVGRTQQMIYHLAAMFRSGRLKPFPIYVDSPMAIEANRLYAKHHDLFDEEATQLSSSGKMAADTATVTPTRTAEESMRLNDLPGPMLVMAGSGMCTAGRILHHLRNNLWKKDSAILIVGYQGEGSLGRQLVDGKREVRIFGDEIVVKASIHTLGGFSAHAGQTELFQWAQSVAPSNPRVCLTHGEERGRQPLGKLLVEKLGLRVGFPHFEETIEL